MKHKIIGNALPNIPWEEKPAGYDRPIWRYSANPIIKRNPAKGIARVFNSAIIPYKGEYIGVFRGDTDTTIPYLYLGHSKDGLNIEIDPTPIAFKDEEGKEVKLNYAYDPRLECIDGRYYIMFCTDNHGPTLGFGVTDDFKNFTLLESPTIPYNRNGVLFPKKINGEYYLLSRPSDSAHTAFGDIFISRSKDLTYWGKHRYLMGKGWEWWCGTKIGAGPAPIETDIGWLVFIHGVTLTCNGMVYSVGAAVLDKEDPTKVLYRSGSYLLTPEENYETTGFVPNVCFPCAALCDADTGRIALYLGCADTCTSIAFTDIDTVLDFVISHNRGNN